MWLYDGAPDHIELSVRDAFPQEGGYVVLFELDTGETRIMATRYPAKYVANWKTNARRHGGPELSRVLISRLHPRYEKIKRLLTTKLSETTEGATPQELTLEAIMGRASDLFAIAPASNANLGLAMQHQ